jgi:hypothetical protein
MMDQIQDSILVSQEQPACPAENPSIADDLFPFYPIQVHTNNQPV